MVVSVLQKEPQIMQSGKAQVQDVRGKAVKDQKQSTRSFRVVID